MTPHDVVIWLLRLSGYAIALLLLWPFGNELTKALLSESGISRRPPSAPLDTATAPHAGRYIGALERTLIVIGIIVRSWEVIAAVVALKSVARYKELETRITAEYFLVGSLVSIVWAAVVGMALIWYDDTYGWGITTWIADRLVAP